MLFKITSIVALFTLLVSAASGQDVTVDKVKFNALRDYWVEIEIQLTCNGNSAPDARDSKFLENIVVKPYLAYGKGDSADEFVYFTSEVEILVMEQRDKNNVYFYLPGAVMKRDGLKYPKYYYIELEVNGEIVPPTNNAFKGVDLTSIPNMKSMTESGAAINEDVLLPVYYTPAEQLRGVRDLPVFRRSDPQR
ncbi:MAG: hypothetical protein ACPGKS_00635 [Coraliomargarita sp.]